MDFFQKDKAIKDIRTAIESYLKNESEQRKVAEDGLDGYGYDERSNQILSKLERELDSQYNFIEKKLNDFGFVGNPVELINIFAESKIKAIKILEA